MAVRRQARGMSPQSFRERINALRDFSTAHSSEADNKFLLYIGNDIEENFETAKLYVFTMEEVESTGDYRMDVEEYLYPARQQVTSNMKVSPAQRMEKLGELKGFGIAYTVYNRNQFLMALSEPIMGRETVLYRVTLEEKERTPGTDTDVVFNDIEKYLE